MNKEFSKDNTNSWVAPLPFRSPRQRLPNNREQALNRLMPLRWTLVKKPEMKEHFVDFMKKIFSNGHAELAPALKKDQECWSEPVAVMSDIQQMFHSFLVREDHRDYLRSEVVEFRMKVHVFGNCPSRPSTD
ncbi:hypothetical protein SKAU_G00020380 [Synaphobranchus kaupii]|uniref:Uncharacterized protein n=1 Tax=Synaphobranchus kaupii TaxID=118154 RepID=A0A9Q1GBR0_SYNKA|nr:hypothetical protein SKAU_G00020380 [Synaphobranchus kaupii]